MTYPTEMLKLHLQLTVTSTSKNIKVELFQINIFQAIRIVGTLIVNQAIFTEVHRRLVY